MIETGWLKHVFQLVQVTDETGKNARTRLCCVLRSAASRLTIAIVSYISQNICLVVTYIAIPHDYV